MAIDPNKPWLNEGFTLSYNPFYANQTYVNGMGSAEFVQQNGQWYQRQAIPGSGDMDFSPTQYNWVPYSGNPAEATYNTTSGDYDITANYQPGMEYGVNFDLLNQNNPNIGANWGVYDNGGFMRDSMGYTQFKILQYDATTGGYITMSKTGDKEGTLQLWMPDGQGGMRVVKNLGTQRWDTNKDVFEQSAFKIGSIALGPVASYYAPLLWGGQAGTLGATIGKALWDGFSAIAPETAQMLQTAWDTLSATAKEAFGSIDAWSKSFSPDFQQFLNSDAASNIMQSGFGEPGTGVPGGDAQWSQFDATGLEDVINSATQPNDFRIDLNTGPTGLEDIFNPTTPSGGTGGPPMPNPNIDAGNISNGEPGGNSFDRITVTAPPVTTPVPTPVPVLPGGGGGPTPPVQNPPPPAQQNPPPAQENPPSQEQKPPPKKGDITFKDGVMMVFNGVNWVAATLGSISAIWRLLNGGGGGPGGGPGGGMGDGNGYGGILGLLFDLLGQGVAADRQESTADKLIAMYNDQQAKAAPWEEKLARSYTDQGQQDIMNSPAFMNAQYQYKQGIDRKAAKAGTLTNPESGILGDPRLARGRSAALQRYGLEYLDEYRKPIQEQVGMYTKNASDYKLLAALGLGTEMNIPSQWANTFAKYRLGDGSFDWSKISKEIEDFGGNIGAWYDWLTQEPAPGQGAGSDEAAIEFQQKFPGLDPTPENLRAYYDNYDFWQTYFKESETG